MIGVVRLLRHRPRVLTKTRVFSFLMIAASEKAALFRIREIFYYHWRGSP
jgi:hypothetical protein